MLKDLCCLLLVVWCCLSYFIFFDQLLAANISRISFIVGAFSRKRSAKNTRGISRSRTWCILIDWRVAKGHWRSGISGRGAWCRRIQLGHWFPHTIAVHLDPRRSYGNLMALAPVHIPTQPCRKVAKGDTEGPHLTQLTLQKIVMSRTPIATKRSEAFVSYHFFHHGHSLSNPKVAPAFTTATVKSSSVKWRTYIVWIVISFGHLRSDIQSRWYSKQSNKIK